MKPENQWPKRLSAGSYAGRWDADLTKNTVVNRIKSGALPGGQDEGGRWFVWVHKDFTPAWDYQGPNFAPQPQPQEKPVKASPKAQSLADNIYSDIRKAG